MPAHLWHPAQSRCRCGRGEPSPGADVGGSQARMAEPVRAQCEATESTKKAQLEVQALCQPGYVGLRRAVLPAKHCLRRTCFPPTSSSRWSPIRSSWRRGTSVAFSSVPPSFAPTTAAGKHNPHTCRARVARHVHICAKTGLALQLAPPTSAPGLSASHLGTAVRRNASSYVQAVVVCYTMGRITGSRGVCGVQCGRRDVKCA
jgi:hypothetical protein